MAFDLKLPQLPPSFSDAEVRAAFGSLAPRLLAYLLSFLVLAIMWINHHALFDKLRHVTPGLVWHDMALLFVMSLIPLPTHFLATHPLLPVSAMLYGAVMSLNSLTFLILRRYAESKAGLIPYNPAANRRNRIALGLYILSIPLAGVSVWAAYLIFIGIPAWYFVPRDTRTAS